MNFNSDFQSNQNRLRSTSEVINLSLDASKTKTKLNSRYFIRFFFEIAFVIFAIGLGYIQGLKSFNAYSANNKSVVTSVINAESANNTVQNRIPENHQDLIPAQQH